MKRLSIGLSLAAFAGAASATPAPKTTKTRFIVTFDAKAKQADRDEALDALDAKAARHIATDGDTDAEISMALVDLPAGRTLSADLSKALCRPGKRCAALKRIVSIEKDRRVKWIESAHISFQASPLPSFAGVMEGLRMPKASDFIQNPMTAMLAAQRGEETWGIKRVHASSAWATCASDKVKTCQGAGVKVAVIDTGIDGSHPELRGAVDGGYSAILKSENPADYQDDNGHGTHVAGTIAAAKDGKGVVGVAPSARLYAVKALDADGSGNLSDIVDGIIWAAKNKMDVVNMSLGSAVDSDAMKRAVGFARGSGVVIVAAAGNSGEAVGFPGSYDDVIAVAASDFQDKVAPFSSRGPQVDFIAPGVDILSSRTGGGFASYSGTSMASPHVAGMAAIAVAQGYVGLNGPDGVMAQLKKAASPLPVLTLEMQGAGMIDAGKLAR